MNLDVAVLRLLAVATSDRAGPVVHPVRHLAVHGARVYVAGDVLLHVALALGPSVVRVDLSTLSSLGSDFKS